MPGRTGFVEKLVNECVASILERASKTNERLDSDDALDDFVSEFTVDFLGSQRIDSLLDVMMELSIGPDNRDLVDIYHDTDGDWYSAIMMVVEFAIREQVFTAVRDAIEEEYKISHQEQVLGSRSRRGTHDARSTRLSRR